MAQIVVGLEPGELFGRCRIKRMIERFENHCTVCGFGRSGRSAAEELQREGDYLIAMGRHQCLRNVEALPAGVHA